MFDGLTQFSSDEDIPDISNLVIEQDGVRYGQLSGVDIDDSGLVTAVFDNGVRKAILATTTKAEKSAKRFTKSRLRLLLIRAV